MERHREARSVAAAPQPRTQRNRTNGLEKEADAAWAGAQKDMTVRRRLKREGERNAESNGM